MRGSLKQKGAPAQDTKLIGTDSKHKTLNHRDIQQEQNKCLSRENVDLPADTEVWNNCLLKQLYFAQYILLCTQQIPVQRICLIAKTAAEPTWSILSFINTISKNTEIQNRV